MGKSFWAGGNQWSPTRGGHEVNCHGTLHYQEIGTPISKGKHEAQPHYQTECGFNSAILFDRALMIFPENDRFGFFGWLYCLR